MSNRLSRVESMLQHLVRRHSAVSRCRIIRANDREFLDRVHRVAEENLANPHFSTADAAGCIGISRMHLNRRLQTLTGKSTHRFIREMRLECARTVLLTESAPIASVAARVGFRSLSQFAKAFRLRYGFSPARYRREGPSATAIKPPFS